MKNNLLLIFSLINTSFLMPLEIREPLQEEIRELAEVYYESWHDTYGIIAPHLKEERTPANCLKKWIKYYNNKNFFILVAVKDKKIAGVSFAGSKTFKAKLSGYDSEIDKLYILPKYKGQGIGSALLKAALEKLHKKGLKKTIVISLTKNINANSFYEKNGGKRITQLDVEFNEKMNVYEFST